MIISRRELLQSFGATAIWSVASSTLGFADPVWHNVEEWGLEGKGWLDTERFYDRFPARAKSMVPDNVWNLSRQSAGMYVRFRTDSPNIKLRMDLLSSSLALPHMPATGVSGFDLYARMGSKKWQWVKQAMPTAQHVEGDLANGIAPGLRDYVGYLPLYNGVTKLEIGVDAGAKFEPMAPDKRKPIVFYGTSICQGACASRPGIAYTSIVGRMFDEPVINLGFSGNGRMDSGVVDLLAELDPSIYIIDCLPNMSAAMVKERTEPLVQKLRSARPNTPILLVEDRTFGQAPLYPNMLRDHAARRAELSGAFDRLRSAGVSGMHYLKGDRLLGTDSEGTTDGSHPNDLGMMRFAEVLKPAILSARR
ncbi:MAG: SGNH/GDSL hydrolase family protein [Chthonomonadales bacterium]